METTIPIFITVIQHPLIQSVSVAWSATGMVPQTHFFSSEGGTVEAQLTSETPLGARIHCHIQMNFAIPNWEVIQFEITQSVAQGGDRIVIDPDQWLQSLHLRFQIAIDPNQDVDLFTAVATDLTSNRDQLVINLNWQFPHHVHPVKLSHRLIPNQTWKVPYLLFPEEQTVLNLSAFGIINQRLLRLSAQSFKFAKSQRLSSNLVLIARDKEIQVIDATSA
jgi:hypothetical protein